MTAIENSEIQYQVNVMINGFEKSMQAFKHFTLMFPFRTGSGVVYTVTIVARKEPGARVFNYNVSARVFIKT
jgi:hypothetical protein